MTNQPCAFATAQKYRPFSAKQTACCSFASYLHVLEHVDANLPPVSRAHVLGEKAPRNPSLHVVHAQEHNTLVYLPVIDVI